ncbi:MAG: nuclease [Verrucomicrobia bacterium]|nr:nuclease [Verrucomicrobiota bacterium]
MIPIEIIADHRENQSSVWESLSAFPDVQLRWKDLQTGDYIVEQGAIFERKTASDFAASLIDQRLFSQAKRLAEQPMRAGIIIEGGPDDWNKLGIRREALQGTLITLTLVFHLSVFRSRDTKETAQLLVYTGRQFARLKEDAPRYRIYKAKRKRTQQLRLLATLPAVGSDRAYRLLDYFGSVQACITATASELEKVPGIGPKTAAAIRDLVSPEINQPLTGHPKSI